MEVVQNNFQDEYMLHHNWQQITLFCNTVKTRIKEQVD